MLELRPNCECCDRDLPFDSVEARICTFECTFCADCVEGALKGVCPNCGAPLQINMAGNCGTCRVKVTAGQFDWVLSRIEQDDVYEG